MSIADEPLVAEILRVFPGAIVTTGRERLMIDKTEAETEALLAASDPAGEYLDSIGIKFPEMAYGQWMTLIEVVVTAYSEKLAAMKAAAAR